MSIPEALKGAQLELSQTPGVWPKLRLCGSYARIFGQELLGTLQVLPYGLRALRLHGSLPHPSEVAAGEAQGVSLARDQRYGPLQRNTLDVYVPPAAEAGLEAAAERPVAIFCHGGVWSTGEKWHYAPMAASLAQQGVVTCVLQYTLYPQAQAPQMAAEVSAALDWTLAHAARFGGCAERVSLVGHSAGAHLWLMALLHRAKSQQQPQQQAGAQGSTAPAAFIGMAGAYDIGRHYAYEAGRGVAFLSTMARVVGGAAGFASQSPAIILARSASAAQPQRRRQLSAAPPKLRGEAVSPAQLDFRYQPPEPQPQEEQPSVPLLSEGELARLPPVFLMSSREDVTVPWEQSLALQSALQAAGCAEEHRVYAGVGHADFAIDWQAPPGSRAPDFAADLVSIVRSARRKGPS